MATPCSHCHEHASYCSACVATALQPSRDQRNAVCDPWRAAKEHCTAHFQQTSATTNHQDMSAALLPLKARMDQLRDLLEERRQLCSELSVKVCQLQVSNAEQRARLEQQNTTDVLQRNLGIFEHYIVDGLSDELEETRKNVCKWRWQWAIMVFSIHPIAIHETFGKICGLPLPHLSELLGVLPASECQSALRWTALVTHTIANCLDISLPHPIRLRYEDTTTTKQTRIQVSAAAMIQESSDVKSSVYRLADSTKEEFQMACQFLQNDILVLCLRAGVPTQTLVSGDAVLCNLQALQRHCYEQATGME